MKQLKDSELRYQRLFEAVQEGILILDATTEMIEDVNPYLIKMLGYSREEFIKKKLWEVGAFKEIDANQHIFDAFRENETIRYEDMPLRAKDGRLIQVEFISNVYWVGDKKVIQCDIHDITRYKSIIAALQENGKKYHDLVNQSPDGFFVIELSGKISNVNKAMCKEFEFSEEEFLSMSIWDIIPKQYLDQYKNSLLKILEGLSFAEATEYTVQGKDGKNRYVEILSAPYFNKKDIIIGFQGIARDITERKRAEDALRHSQMQLESIFNSTMDAIITIDEEQQIITFNPAAEQMFRCPATEAIGKTLEHFIPESVRKNHKKFVHSFGQSASTKRSMKTPALMLTCMRSDSQAFPSEISISRFEIGGQKLYTAIVRDITDRRGAEQRIRQQLEHLTALRAIDRVIASNFDLEISLSEILTHVTMELGVDAADILIFNPALQALEFCAEHGFRTEAVRKAHVRMGESYAGRAALERQLVQIPKLSNEPESLLLTTHLAGEDFVCYYGLPIIAKGQVKGVLEVFHRTSFEPNAEWFDFFKTLAGQTAIAIENVTLFENLQRSNSELTLAYDATIEGWSRALDLRDKETEGHTQRVREMTVKLARGFFGLSEAELVQVRWGALLHDIGKMGVPDGILHKPGPLTEEEWVLMKKHPTFAFEMLSPIRFLRLALDIPYCHHEKWDGTGYPRGLIGTQIPLFARIFAVVDVWDALSSDRPYRPAWTEEKVREHIKNSSGSHFDPQVVDIFLQSSDKN